MNPLLRNATIGVGGAAVVVAIYFTSIIGPVLNNIEQFNPLPQKLVDILNFQLPLIGKTPAQIESQERQAKLAKAIESIDADPFVRDLVENFDARIKDTSIKPVQ